MEFGFGIWLRSGSEGCEMYRKENKLGWPPGGPSSAGPRDVGSPPPRTLNFRTGIEEYVKCLGMASLSICGALRPPICTDVEPQAVTQKF